MNFFIIALHNIRRRIRKMSFLVVGLAVGVAAVVALFNIVQAMRLELGNELDKFGPNIVITPRFQGVGLNYGSSQAVEVRTDVKPLTVGDLPAIQAIPDGDSINIISPKLVGAVTLNNQTVILVGVETKYEFAMKPWFALQALAGQPPGRITTDLALMRLPANGLILGSGAARALNIQAGDQVSVNGQDFTAAGILQEMGTEEDGLIYANLTVVQDLLGRPGTYSMIEVSGFCNFCPIEDMAEQMTAVLPNGRVTALRQAALIREETINRFSVFGFILSAVVLLVASLIILTTMLSAVNERTREIGIFRAVGFRRVHVLLIIELEAILVSVPAGIIGYLAGSSIARFGGPFLAQMQVTIPWNLDMIAPAILVAIGLTVMASLYPAIKAANLDPAEALRYI